VLARALSPYEGQPPQADPGNGKGRHRVAVVRRVGPDGTMAPLIFGSLQAAQTRAGRLRPKETRVVAVERDGRRHVVDPSRR
jgi:hypothetical protein